MTDNTNNIAITSPDLREERLNKLKALFPDLFDGEGQLDEKALKALVNEEASGTIERFRFEWAGKQKSKRFAFTPSKATLKYDPSRSINRDGSENEAGEAITDNTSQNLIIEGDNLEVLKLLQASYFEKVKCIYIDPPYNKGKDFIYPDDYSQSKQAYWEENGVKKGGVSLQALPESHGRRHSLWLNMMQSRLLLARQLLRQDGVLFISIDENEQANLVRLGKDIFGADNFVACLPTIMNLKGNHDAFGFSDTHEYIIVFARDKACCNLSQFDIDEDATEDWSEDDYGLFKRADTLRRTGQDASRKKRPKGWFPVFISEEQEVYVTDDDKPRNSGDITLYPINEAGEELSWSWGKEKIKSEPYNLTVVDGRSGKNIYKKQRPSLGQVPTAKPKSTFYKPEYSTSTATTALKRLMGVKAFDGPKPVSLIEDLLEIAIKNGGLVLDFFAGSGTLAEAASRIQARFPHGQNYLLVQVPEKIDAGHEAYSAGYRKISDITIERAKRAGAKIREENPEADIDTGFRVFTLDNSHFPENVFAPDPDKSEEENLKALNEHLQKAAQTRLFDEDETNDLITEIALKNGYGLFYTLEVLTDFADNTVYRLAGNDKATLLCMDGSLKDSTIEALKAHSEEQLIVLKTSLDTSKKFNLQTAFKENLQTF